MDGSPNQVIAAFAAVVVAVVGLYLQNLQARKAIEQSNQIAWGYNGGQQCADYRAQVLELWNRGVSEERIIAWFTHEQGSEHNDFGDGDSNPDDTRGQTAYEDFEDGCGSVPELLATLEGATPETSKTPLKP